MRSISLSIAALIGLGFSAIAVPAWAAPISGAISKTLTPAAITGENSAIVQVQYRRDRGYYRDRRGHGGSDGGAVAAGILGGLVLGAIIANQAQPQHSVQYCMQRFRSYDPASGTYLGNDGYRHRCP